MAVRLTITNGNHGAIKGYEPYDRLSKTWALCPWPRLPLEDESVDFWDDFLPITNVFYYLNGNVWLYADIADGDRPLSADWVKALIDIGFVPHDSRPTDKFEET